MPTYVSEDERMKRFKDFQKASQAMVEFLREYGNPHTTVIITQTSAEMLSGELCMPFEPLD